MGDFKTFIISIFSCVLTLGFCPAQEMGVRASAISSKEVVLHTSEYADSLALQGMIDQAIAFIDKARKKCADTEDGQLCGSGLDFAMGRLMQKAAAVDTTRSEELISGAVDLYLKVLDQYPDNSAALTNLSILAPDSKNKSQSISRLNTILKKRPYGTKEYRMLIGDFYLADSSLNESCHSYGLAYQSEPTWKKASTAVVDHYIKYGLACGWQPWNDPMEFAFALEEQGHSENAAKLLEHEMAIAVEKEAYGSYSEFMVAWAEILVKNSWLSVGQVSRLKSMLPVRPNIQNPLSEIIGILKMQSIEDFGDLEFWQRYNPYLFHFEVSPASVTSRILYMRGLQFKGEGDTARAEAFMGKALESRPPDVLYTMIASKLAELYDEHPELDPDEKKINGLIVELFNRKGMAYSESDYTLIRRYHTTLGIIFYNREKWDGNYAANARFQLEHALYEDAGPIINPDLRKMLGNVYHELKRDEQAVGTYSRAIEDYLSLDRLEEALAMCRQIQKDYFSSMGDLSKRKLAALTALVIWRQDFQNPNNDLLSGESNMFEYLTKAKIAQDQLSQDLGAKFVKVQFFKGLSDLASQLPDSDLYEKQLIFSSSLGQITELSNLTSPQDYVRARNIQAAFNQSIDQSQMFPMVQSAKSSAVELADYKIYDVPNVDHKIMIPKQVFEINGILEEYYKSSSSERMASIKYVDGQFVLIKS